MKCKKNNIRQYGFTLVEILIVLAIIVILAVLVIGSTYVSRQKGRDSRRKADFNSIVQAAELYQVDKGNYPILNASSTDASWDQLANELKPYLKSPLPKDPVNSSGEREYRYYGNNAPNCLGGTEFELTASLEFIGDNDDSDDGGTDPDLYETGTSLVCQ